MKLIKLTIVAIAIISLVGLVLAKFNPCKDHTKWEECKRCCQGYDMVIDSWFWNPLTKCQCKDDPINVTNRKKAYKEIKSQYKKVRDGREHLF